MREVGMNNEMRVYVSGECVVSHNRSGCPPMSEARLLERIAKALRQRQLLDGALVDMREMLKGLGEDPRTHIKVKP
jgi:hypothetical protein